MAMSDDFPLHVEHPGFFSKIMVFMKGNMHLAFAALVIIYVAQIVYYLFVHPLHKIPGPFLARFSGIWRNVRYFRSTWHNDILELHEIYGPVVRIAPNEISFVDVKALPILYGHGTTARKVSRECEILLAIK